MRAACCQLYLLPVRGWITGFVLNRTHKNRLSWAEVAEVTRVMPRTLVHPSTAQPAGGTKPPSPHISLPWEGFKADTSSREAIAPTWGFGAIARKSQSMAHETCIWGESSVSTTLHHSEGLCFGERGRFAGYLLGRAPAVHNLTHTCSPALHIWPVKVTRKA